MHRHRGDPAVGVPELPVRPALADLNEPNALEAGDDLPRFENGDRPHLGRRLGDEDRLCPDELRLKRGLAVLKEHGDDLTQVRVQLVETLTLAVSTGEPRDVPHEEAGLWIALDDGGVSAHIG